MVAGLIAGFAAKSKSARSWVGGSRPRRCGGRRGVRSGRRTRRAAARTRTPGRTAARGRRRRRTRRSGPGRWAGAAPGSRRDVDGGWAAAGGFGDCPCRPGSPVLACWRRSWVPRSGSSVVGRDRRAAADGRRAARGARPGGVGETDHDRVRTTAGPGGAGVALGVFAGLHGDHVGAGRPDGQGGADAGDDVGVGWWRCSSRTSTRARVPPPSPWAARAAAQNASCTAVNIPAARAWASAVAPRSAPGLRTSTSR